MTTPTSDLPLYSISYHNWLVVPRPLLPSVARFLHTMQKMKCGHMYAVTSGGQRVYTHLEWYPSIMAFFVYIYP